MKFNKVKSLRSLLHVSILLIVVSSCDKFEEVIGNDQLRTVIDNMPITETWYKIKLDTNGNNSDTTEIKYLKIDSSGEIVYKERIYWRKDIRFVNREYFRDLTGLFFQEIRADNGYMYQTYENYLNFRDEIAEAQMMTVFEDEDPFQVEMDYEYFRNLLGKKKELTITAVSDTIISESIITYNTEEKIVQELILFNLPSRDTGEIRQYLYKDSKLSRYYHRNLIGIRRETTCEYDGNENPIRETEKVYEFEGTELREYWIRTYSYDDLGELRSSVERDTINDVVNFYDHICLR